MKRHWLAFASVFPSHPLILFVLQGPRKPPILSITPERGREAMVLYAAEGVAQLLGRYNSLVGELGSSTCFRYWGSKVL